MIDRIILILGFSVAVVICSACHKSSGTKEDTDSLDTSDGDTDSDTDSDTDVDGDTDGDSDTSSDTDSETGSDSASDTGTEILEPMDNEWIFIEGGTFEMGSESFENAQPVHSVTVPSFEIQKTEVTVHQYQQCVNAGGCTQPSDTYLDCDAEEYRNWLDGSRLNHPVNCVTRIQAAEYCSWFNAELPSEASWEYAARNLGQKISFPWGNDNKSCEYAVMIEAEQPGCSKLTTWPVCSKPLGNTLQGICDMAGNISEFMQDDYHLSYEGAPSDGTAWIALEKYPVTRGGNYGGEILSSSYREYVLEELGTATSIGFRCVREVND